MQSLKSKSVLGIIIGIGTFVGIYLLFISEIQSGDFQAYYFAAKAALDGEPFIGHQPPTGVNTEFVYPPIAILLFLPFGLFKTWGAAYQLQVLIILILGIGIVRIIVLYLQSHDLELDRLDITLISATVFLSAHSVWTLAHGQMNMHLLFLIALGYFYLEKDQSEKSGTMFSLASVVKIFPVIYGFWLLKNNDKKAIVAAIITGLSGVILSFAIFGLETHLRYLEFLATDRSRINRYQGGMGPNTPMVTLNRPLSIVFPNAPDLVFTLVPTLVVAPIVAYIYLHCNDEIDELFAYLATTIAIILIMPSNQYYILLTIFPLVPLLYLSTDSDAFGLLAIGALVSNAPFAPVHLEAIFEKLPLPNMLESIVLDIITPILTFGSVTLYGLILILLACVLHVRSNKSKTILLYR